MIMIFSMNVTLSAINIYCNNISQNLICNERKNKTMDKTMD